MTAPGPDERTTTTPILATVFPAPDRALVSAALLRLADNERLRDHIAADPYLNEVSGRIASRYLAGRDIDEVLATAARTIDRGHAVSFELAPTTPRNSDDVVRSTNRRVELIHAIAAHGLDAAFNVHLAHYDLDADFDVIAASASELAEAAAEHDVLLYIFSDSIRGAEVSIELYRRLGDRHPNLGISLPLRLHDIVDEFPTVLAGSGPVRLVAGTFAAPDDVALPFVSDELSRRFLDCASELLDSGRRVAVATYNSDLLDQLTSAAAVTDAAGREFEGLNGTGEEIIDSLHERGFATREHLVLGGVAWWSHVLHRMAELPEVHLAEALLDAIGD